MGTTVKKLDVKLVANNSQLKSGLKQSTQQVNSFSKSLKSMGGVMAGAFAITKVASFFKESVKLYGIQEQAEKKLSDSIKATGGSVAELLPRYKNLASEIQKVTTVGDEQVLGLISLGKVMGIADTEMEKATKGAIGLSKAFGIDLNTSMKMIAAGIQGDTTLLNRYVPQLRFATTQAEKMAIMNEAMANGWEVATGEAETFTGKMEQLSNVMGDIREGIGKVIAETMTEPLKDLGEWVTENQSGIIIFFEGLIGLVKKFAETGATAAGVAKDLADNISGMDEYFDSQKKIISENITKIREWKDEFIGGFKTNTLKQFADAENTAKDATNLLVASMLGLLTTTEDTGKTFGDLHPKIKQIERDYTDYNNILEDIKKSKQNDIEVTDALKEEYEDYNTEIDEGIVLGGDWVKVNREMAGGAKDTAKEIKKLAKSFEDMADDFEKGFRTIYQGLIDITSLISEDLSNAIADVGNVFADAISGDWVGAIAGALPALRSLGDAIFEIGMNARTYEEIQLSIAETLAMWESLAADTGKTVEELITDAFSGGLNIMGIDYMRFLNQLEIDTKETFGIISQIIAGAFDGAGNIIDLAGGGKPAPDSSPGTGPLEGFSSGGSFIVPSGYNENFRLGNVGVASAGERIDVTPQGQGGKGGTNIEVNMYPAKGANSSDLMREFINGYRLNLHNVQGEIG